jgi:hypothetical protein
MDEKLLTRSLLLPGERERYSFVCDDLWLRLNDLAFRNLNHSFSRGGIKFSVERVLSMIRYI